jgi:hypothetical protein
MLSYFSLSVLNMSFQGLVALTVLDDKLFVDLIGEFWKFNR